jgi:hypothetical protein
MVAADPYQPPQSEDPICECGAVLTNGICPNGPHPSNEDLDGEDPGEEPEEE